MKNASLWVMVLVVALVGSAIWYEVQYRQSSRPEGSSPFRHASTPPKKPAKDSPKKFHPTSPAGPTGQMIG